MTLEVDAGGDTRTVEVARTSGNWTVKVDGRVYFASVVPAGDRWSLLLRPADGAGALRASRSYDVAFTPAGRGAVLVHVDAGALKVSVRTQQGVFGRRVHAASGADSGQVTAPMPGRLVKVLVAPGSVVEARQPLAVVEAMKMENELRAPRAGIVREVRAAEGASVDAGAVLVVIE